MIVNNTKYLISVPFSIGDGYSRIEQDIYQWNEYASKIVERFGLPGDKYTTKMSNNSMTFFFEDSQDALLAKLILGGNVSYMVVT